MPKVKSDTRKDVFKKIKNLVREGDWHDLVTNGTGAPGETLEAEVGVNDDKKSLEVKYSGGSALITLFHKDQHQTDAYGNVDQGITLRDVLYTNGYAQKDDPSLRSLRNTIRRCAPISAGEVVPTYKPRKPPRFRLITLPGDSRDGEDLITQPVKSDGSIREDACGSRWTYLCLTGRAQCKLDHASFTIGKVDKVNKRVRYEALWDVEDFRGGRVFVDAILAGLIAVDYDMTEYSKEDPLRNHGTKFRVRWPNALHLWKTVSYYDAERDKLVSLTKTRGAVRPDPASQDPRDVWLREHASLAPRIDAILAYAAANSRHAEVTPKKSVQRHVRPVKGALGMLIEVIHTSVVYVALDGQKRVRKFDTPREAREFAAELEQMAQEQVIGHPDRERRVSPV